MSVRFFASIYAELYEDFKNQLAKEKDSFPQDSQELVPFVSVKGRRYSSEQPVRLMLIGRAVNGWEPLPSPNATDFVNAVIATSQSDGFANWLDSDERGELFSRHTAETEPRYYLNKSPFWRTAKAIWHGLNDCPDNKRWIDSIVWSNLYKLAPRNGGNPSNALCSKQAESCRKILKGEIETYLPTHILMITGWEWFNHSSDSYDFSRLFNEVTLIGRNRRENDVFVEGTALFSLPNSISIPAVVACRPEGRPEKKYVEQVVQAFQRLCGSHSEEDFSLRS